MFPRNALNDFITGSKADPVFAGQLADLPIPTSEASTYFKHLLSSNRGSMMLLAMRRIVRSYAAPSRSTFLFHIGHVVLVSTKKQVRLTVRGILRMWAVGHITLSSATRWIITAVANKLALWDGAMLLLPGIAMSGHRRLSRAKAKRTVTTVALSARPQPTAIGFLDFGPKPIAYGWAAWRSCLMPINEAQGSALDITASETISGSNRRGQAAATFTQFGGIGYHGDAKPFSTKGKVMLRAARLRAWAFSCLIIL